MNLILFYYIGTAGTLHWSHSQWAPIPPTASTPMGGSRWKRETTEHGSSTISPCACEQNTLWGAAQPTTVLLQQRIHFGTQLKGHWPYTKVALYNTLLELLWTSLSWARKALQAFLSYRDAGSCHYIQSQLDKLYIWAVTFPPCKYSRAIIQQIALGCK